MPHDFTLRTSRRLAAALVAWAALAGPAFAADAPAAAAPAPLAAPKLRALVQTWYLFDEATPDTLRLRRVNLWVSGQVTPNLFYNVMVNPLRPLALPTVVTDPAKPGNATLRSGGDDRILQDAFVRATWGDWQLQAGQFKQPMSAEALQAAVDLLTARRALFNESSTQIGFVRELGVQVAGKPLPGVDVTLGLFNGEGQNVLDKNDRKDVAGRVDYTPLPGVKLGLSHLRGTRGATNEERTRTGLNAEWAASPWLLTAEALTGADGAESKLGWYTQAAYSFSPAWQALARYEAWNPTLSQGAASEERDLTLGLNWYLAGPSKAAINMIRQELPQGGLNHTAILVWQLML